MNGHYRECDIVYLIKILFYGYMIMVECNLSNIHGAFIGNGCEMCCMYELCWKISYKWLLGWSI